jgi:tetratricopeptide (TPR) repeat protein
LGQCFSLAALRCVLENGDYGCEPLLRRHLIRHDGEQLMFDHALIRDGVYASMLRSRCQELHKRAAAWFADTDPVLHAEHLDRAGDASAARALDAAARAEFMSYRAESALNLARRAFSRAMGAAERCEIACLEGEILSELGQFDEARVAYETACSEAASDEAARCRARIGLAGALRLADRLDEAHAQLDAAEEAADRLGLVAELSRLHFLRGNLHFPLGRIDLCRREHDAALHAAQASGRPELVVSALGGVADAAFAQGHFQTALACYSRCVALAREQGLGRVEVANLVMIQTCHQMMGIPGGREEGEAALLAASRVGHRRAEILALHGLTFWHFWALQGDFGRAHGRRAVELCERYGLTRFRAESFAFLAFAEHLAGNEKEAIRLFEAAMADAREHSTRYFLLSVIGYYAYVVTDPRRRAELLDEGDRISRGPGLAHDRMQYFLGAIEAALRGAEWDRADSYADQVEQTFAAEPLPRVDTCVARARVLAALGRGVRTSDMRSALERIQADIGRMDMNLYAASVERALSELSG